MHPAGPTFESFGKKPRFYACHTYLVENVIEQKRQPTKSKWIDFDREPAYHPAVANAVNILPIGISVVAKPA